MSNKNKLLGSSTERYYAKIFRSLGYPFVKTTRYAARFLDDLGIDLVGLPFYVQIKAGIQRGINYSNVLEKIENNIKNTEIEQKPLILIHRKKGIKGKKRKDTDDLVIMSFKVFVKFLK
jgi:uncharacterized protein YmfQ (DUF2313 family)